MVRAHREAGVTLPLTTLLWLIIPPVIALAVVLIHFFRGGGSAP